MSNFVKRIMPDIKKIVDERGGLKALPFSAFSEWAEKVDIDEFMGDETNLKIVDTLLNEKKINLKEADKRRAYILAEMLT